MGGCDDGFFQQRTGNIGLVFPAVKSDVTVPLQQGVIVGDGAAGGIDNQAAMAQTVEKRLVTQVPCGPLAVAGERCMESDDVALALQDLERGENYIMRTILIFPWRVVEQNGKTELGSPAGNDGADVANTDNAEGQAVGR